MAITKFDRRYFHNILTHYNAIEALKNNIMPSPRFCTLQTSNQCNQHCQGCSFGHHDVQLDGRIMTWEDHKKILIDLIDVGIKSFEFCGGGEPTCLPYLLNALKFIHSRGCHFGMITNGLLLSDELINFVIDYGTYIRISLETANSSVYQEYKKVPELHYSRVLDHMRALVERKHSSGSLCDIGIKFGVSKTLCNYSHFEEAIELANEFQPDSIQFKCLRHKPEELSLEDKKIQNSILQLLKEKCSVPIIDWLIPYYPQDVPQCWLNPLHTVVDYLGDVYLCCYYYYREREHKLGNMLRTPFSKLWYSQEHWDRIRSIDRHKCALVDCKFFGHHRVVDEAFINGRQEFL